MNKQQIQDLKLLKKQQKRTQGRWTKKQQQLFLKGINTFGKNWKKIKQLLPSRSLTQIRSHAQKYFIRIKNQKYNSEDQFSDDNSFDAEVSYIPKILKPSHFKQDSITHQHQPINTLPEIEACSFEQKPQKDIVQNNSTMKIDDQTTKIHINEPISEQNSSSEFQYGVNTQIPDNWYSLGPSVFHQIMVYYQDKIISNGTVLSLVDY